MLAAGGGSSGEGGRKRRQEACALGFLSEGLIVVCQRGQGSFSWLAPSPFSLASFCLLPPQVPRRPPADWYRRLQAVKHKSRFTRRERKSQRKERRVGCRQRDEFVPAYQTSPFTQSGMVMTVKSGWVGTGVVLGS